MQTTASDYSNSAHFFGENLLYWVKGIKYSESLLFWVKQRQYNTYDNSAILRVLVIIIINTLLVADLVLKLTNNNKNKWDTPMKSIHIAFSKGCSETSHVSKE